MSSSVLHRFVFAAPLIRLSLVYWSSHSLPSVAVLVPSVSVAVPDPVASSLVSLSPSDVEIEDSVTDSGTGPNDLIVVGAVVSDY